MGIEATIFDLDETLLDTSALLEPRQRQEWDRVLRHIDEVTQFPQLEGQPPIVELPGRARAEGLAVGVVTHGYRPYADALLRAHGITVDAMITGSDGYPRKPAPSSLVACAELLEVEPENCVYVGDTPDDFGAAANAGMSSVGVGWAGTTSSWRHGWPDISVDRPSTVLDLFGGGGGLGLFAEMRVTGVEPRYHWGSIARLGSASYAIGRYYPTKDRRHGLDSLTQLILESKDSVAAQRRLADCFVDVIEAIKGTPPMIVTSVPPDPDGVDRFAALRELLTSGFPARNEALLRQLYCVDDYKMMPRDARAGLVADRFEATRALNGESILLLDDVINTGSQAGACREALKAAGAGGVSVLVAGVNQDSLSDPCPSCGDLGGIQVTRTNHRTGEKFLGCSRFYSADCRWTGPL